MSNAAGLLRENLSLLVGRSPEPAALRQIEALALSVDGVLAVHDLRADYVGPDVLHAGMHIEVRRGTCIEEADRIAHEVEARIHQDVSSAFCVIHVDPEQAGYDEISMSRFGESLT